MTSRTQLITPHDLAIGLSLMLVLIYALVPANPEFFGVPAWPPDMLQEHLLGTLVLGVIVVMIGYGTRNLTSKRKPTPVHPAAVLVVFLGGCFWLPEYSWADVREGIQGTISALFRILWFIIIISLSQENLSIKKRMIYTFATLTLMFLDQSRTYFLVALFILLVNFSRIAMIPAVTAGLMVAAIRSNENSGFINSIAFAIGGEGYLGSRGVLQVLSLPEHGLNFSVPAAQALFAPATALLTAIAKRLGFATDSFDSSTYLGSYIEAVTLQTYPPMGGFFILSEFVRAGWFGILCMALYMITAFVLTKRLFDTAEFPVGSFIALLSIKNSPMTYWNLVLVVWIALHLYREANRVFHSLRPNSTHTPQLHRAESK